jgi:hypothetical protein
MFPLPDETEMWSKTAGICVIMKDKEVDFVDYHHTPILCPGFK